MIQRKQGNNMKCRAKFMENDGTLKKDKRKREFTYEKIYLVACMKIF